MNVVFFSMNLFSLSKFVSFKSFQTSVAISDQCFLHFLTTANLVKRLSGTPLFEISNSNDKILRNYKASKAC